MHRKDSHKSLYTQRGRKGGIIMSIKKKLGMGILSAALGISLIGGGTFAYFSDTAVQTNTFASGTIDLDVAPEVIVDLENLKPGDWMKRSFELQNNGSLPIKYVTLGTDYTVTDLNGNAVDPELAAQYADSIIVQFLKNTTGNKDYNVILELSLHELNTMTPEDLATKLNKEVKYVVLPIVGKIPVGFHDVKYQGIGVNESHDFDVKFVFEETGENQNHLQGLELELTWTFEGFQEDGQRR